MGAIASEIGDFKLRVFPRVAMKLVMAGRRKRHVQQELFRHGGKRAGAGRPKQGARASERHKKRQTLRPYEPVHVVLRAVPEIGTLRRRAVYAAVRKALLATVGRDNCRIVHISIQNAHIHLLVEADHRMALARGMQAFQISAAKHINAALGAKGVKPRKGTVFPDRYHARIITSRKDARHALAYVLNNWRHHREQRAAFARTWRLDLFSRAPTFDGWRQVDATTQLDTTGWGEPYEALPVWEPRTWLLREGWRLYGLIDTHEVPGKKVQMHMATVLAE